MTTNGLYRDAKQLKNNVKGSQSDQKNILSHYVQMWND